jgi:uncharacterized membrane protein
MNQQPQELQNTNLMQSENVTSVGEQQKEDKNSQHTTRFILQCLIMGLLIGSYLLHKINSTPLTITIILASVVIIVTLLCFQIYNSLRKKGSESILFENNPNSSKNTPEVWQTINTISSIIFLVILGVFGYLVFLLLNSHS